MASSFVLLNTKCSTNLWPSCQSNAVEVCGSHSWRLKHHLAHLTMFFKSYQSVFPGMCCFFVFVFFLRVYSKRSECVCVLTNSLITSCSWRHEWAAECFRFRECVCFTVTLWVCRWKRKKKVHTCTKQSFYISISASPRNKLSGRLWQGRNLSLGDEWACQIRDGLIVSIDCRFNHIDWITGSDAWTDICSLVTTWCHMSLFVCLHFSLCAVITIDGAAESWKKKGLLKISFHSSIWWWKIQ